MTNYDTKDIARY